MSVPSSSPLSASPPSPLPYPSSQPTYDPFHLSLSSHSALHSPYEHFVSSSAHAASPHLTSPVLDAHVDSNAMLASSFLVSSSSSSSSSSPLAAASSPTVPHSSPLQPRRCPASSFVSSPSVTTACLSVSTVPRLLHPFFSSSDLLSHSAALFTLSDLLTFASLNRCIASLARAERIWRPRLQAAIAIRYPAAAQLASEDEKEDEEKGQSLQQQQQQQHQQQQHYHAHRPQQQQRVANLEATVQFTCPYLSAMQKQGRLVEKGSSLSSALPHLISTNPFVSDLVLQLEASTAKEAKEPAPTANCETSIAEMVPSTLMPSAAPSTVTVNSTLPVPLFYSPSASASSVSLPSSKARHIALTQCSLHPIAGCSRLVAPLPPLPAPSHQAYWAHTRVLYYPAPPSLDSCEAWPTLPLCAECRAGLAVCMKDYYDYRGEWAGQFTMTPLSIVIVHPPDAVSAAALNSRPVCVLDVRYSHIGGYDGVDHRRFEVEYIRAGHTGCTCGCGGMSAGVSSVGEWSVRVMHRYRSGIYAMDSPLNVQSNDRLEYSHLRERERHAQRKRKTSAAAQTATSQSSGAQA